MDDNPAPQNTESADSSDNQNDGMVVSQEAKTSRLRNLSRYQLILAAAVFGAIGAYLIVGGHAATVSLTKAWKTSADWQTGTLQNVATSNNSVVLSSPAQTQAAPQSITSGTDLALNKPAKASSIESSAYPASNAVDGNSKTRWSSKYSDPQWIYVDLGSSYNISEVKLNWEVAYGKAYQIQVSNDANTWTTIYSRTTGAGGINDLTGLKGAGRYVRMYGTARGTQWGYSLWDMAVYGTPASTTSGADLALNKPAKASSTESSAYPASNAVDNSSTTRWASQSSDPQWVYVDLGSTYKINQVKLTWETAYAKAYQIQVSNDANTWTTIYSTSSGAGGVNDLNGLSGTGRYVRVYGTQRGTQWGYSLWDMAVYGTPSSAPPASYAPSGNITLSYDAGSSVSWTSLTGQVSTPSGTSITYQARTSSDNATWSAWSSDITKLSGRYIQVKATLTTSDTSITPVLNSLTLGYNATVTTPTVSLNASPNPITAGQTTTLTWSSVNATSCTASNGWSGAKPTAGSVTSSALSQTTTYTLTCAGTGGSASASATVNVSAATGGTKSIYWGAWIDGDTYGNGRTDAPWDSTSWDLFESHAGKKVSIIHYGQPPMWQQAFAPGTASLVTNRGAIPMMDMGSSDVSLTSITNGTYDSSIAAWADAVKAWGKPFFFRWNWEMNGTWYSWGAQAQKNPSAYVAAWKHMHDVVAAHGATNVTWVWCPNTVFPGSTPLNQLYPGDSYVDWTCLDTYNKGPLEGDTWQTFSQLTQPTYSQLLSVAPSKPIMIGETATNENGGSKANWITDVLQTQLPNNFPNVKAFVWFNWPISENNVTTQWPIESSSSSQNAFRTGISSPYYSSNSYGNLPALTKVKPLP